MAKPISSLVDFRRTHCWSVPAAKDFAPTPCMVGSVGGYQNQVRLSRPGDRAYRLLAQLRHAALAGYGQILQRLIHSPSPFPAAGRPPPGWSLPDCDPALWSGWPFSGTRDWDRCAPRPFFLPPKSRLTSPSGAADDPDQLPLGLPFPAAHTLPLGNFLLHRTASLSPWILMLPPSPRRVRPERRA